MTGVFECLVCHERFEVQIRESEIDDLQDCPFCSGAGEITETIN